MSSRPTTKTTLTLIPYLNCEPFYAGLDDLDLEIVHEVPRRLGELAETGRAVCGPMALADWIRLRERFDLLDDFGIACEGPAHSVLLFAKTDIRKLGEKRIGLTAESSTSVRLLELILERKHAVRDAELYRGTAEEDWGRLLIGDEALRAQADGLDDFPFVFDLGEEWHAWQGLPFVFARWVVAKGVSEEDRRAIAGALSASLAGWRLRVPEIAARRGPDFGLDGEGVLRYLSTFRYRIGPVELLGQKAFVDLLEGGKP
jgi:chorismate dehydratase